MWKSAVPSKSYAQVAPGIHRDELDAIRNDPLSHKAKASKRKLLNIIMNDEVAWRELQKEMRGSQLHTNASMGFLLNSSVLEKIGQSVMDRDDEGYTRGGNGSSGGYPHMMGGINPLSPGKVDPTKSDGGKGGTVASMRTIKTTMKMLEQNDEFMSNLKGILSYCKAAVPGGSSAPQKPAQHYGHHQPTLMAHGGTMARSSSMGLGGGPPGQHHGSMSHQLLLRKNSPPPPKEGRRWSSVGGSAGGVPVDPHTNLQQHSQTSSPSAPTHKSYNSSSFTDLNDDSSTSNMSLSHNDSSVMVKVGSSAERRPSTASMGSRSASDKRSSLLAGLPRDESLRFVLEQALDQSGSGDSQSIDGSHHSLGVQSRGGRTLSSFAEGVNEETAEDVNHAAAVKQVSSSSLDEDVELLEGWGRHGDDDEYDELLGGREEGENSSSSPAAATAAEQSPRAADPVEELQDISLEEEVARKVVAANSRRKSMEVDVGFASVSSSSASSVVTPKPSAAAMMDPAVEDAHAAGGGGKMERRGSEQLRRGSDLILSNFDKKAKRKSRRKHQQQKVAEGGSRPDRRSAAGSASATYGTLLAAMALENELSGEQQGQAVPSRMPSNKSLQSRRSSSSIARGA